MDLEEDEIYDDGSSVAASPLSNLKNKFEQNSAQKKLIPALKPKPAPKNVAKFGGGGYLHGVVGNDKIPKINGSIDNSSKVDKGNDSVNEKGSDSSTIKDKETAKQVIGNALSKRDSKIDIPAVFQANNNAQQTTAPKITPKPKTPVRKTFDTNNNSKSDSNEAEKRGEDKMTGGVEKKNSAETESKGSPVGLSVHERAKLLAGNLPNMKVESPVGSKQKPQTSEKPKSPAGTGPPRKFTIPKSQGGDFAVELRKKLVDTKDPKRILHRVSVKSVIRQFDEKKFKLVSRDTSNTEKAPEKPVRLDEDIDWEDLEQEFKRLKKERASGKTIPLNNDSIIESDTAGIKELEEEEFYDDCGNFVPPERISFIEPMTEEEELGDNHDNQEWEKHGFTGLTDNEEFPRPPTAVMVDGQLQEEYDDVAAALNEGTDEKRDSGELYEPLPDEADDDVPPAVGPKPGEVAEEPPEPPPQPPRPQKDSKDAEKEKKKREKEEKEKRLREEKEEKERKAREEKEEKEKKKKLEKEQKDLKKLADKFKISMSELTKSVGQGKIKKTAKSKGGLAVQQGDNVEIIRMGKPNPDGKFLVRLKEGQGVGYVDSANIELMESGNHEASANGGQIDDNIGETYEDVEGEGEDVELIEEDIYEECS